MTGFMIDLIGWAGVILVLAAYGLMSVSYMDGNSPSYQVLNAIGAIMLVVNSIYLKAYPSVGVNAAWAGIALIMLWRLWWYKDQIKAKRIRIRLPKELRHTYAMLKIKRRAIERAIQRKRDDHKTNDGGQITLPFLKKK